MTDLRRFERRMFLLAASHHFRVRMALIESLAVYRDIPRTTLAPFVPIPPSVN